MFGNEEYILHEDYGSTPYFGGRIRKDGKVFHSPKHVC